MRSCLVSHTLLEICFVTNTVVTPFGPSILDFVWSAESHFLVLAGATIGKTIVTIDAATTRKL